MSVENWGTTETVGGGKDLPSVAQPLFLSAAPTASHWGLLYLTGSKGHLQTLPTGKEVLEACHSTAP